MIPTYTYVHGNPVHINLANLHGPLKPVHTSLATKHTEVEPNR